MSRAMDPCSRRAGFLFLLFIVGLPELNCPPIGFSRSLITYEGENRRSHPKPHGGDDQGPFSTP